MYPADFFIDMAAICATDYPSNGLFDVVERAFCVQLAATYASAVSVGGGTSGRARRKAVTREVHGINIEDGVPSPEQILTFEAHTTAA